MKSPLTTALAVLALGATLWLWAPWALSTDESAPASPERAAPGPLQPTGAAPSPEGGAAARAVAIAPEDRQPATTEDGTAESTRPGDELLEADRITGRVVDGADRPLEDVRVEARMQVEVDLRAPQIEPHPEGARLAAARTGAGGRFSLQVEPLRPVQVHAAAEGYASIQRDEVPPGSDVTLRLQPAAGVYGQVTREGDGQPVESAELRLFHDRDHVQTTRARTGPDGRYEVTGLVPGTVGLIVVAGDLANSSWASLALEAGERILHDVSLGRGACVRGTVRDAVTGLGIAGAELSSWSFLEPPARTDALGEFELCGLRSNARVLEARAAGYGGAAVLLPDGPEAVEILLHPGLTVRGRVVDPGGEPLAGALVTTCGAHEDTGMAWASTTTDARGAFVLADLRTDPPLQLLVRSVGFADHTRPLPHPLPDGGEEDLGTLTLEPGLSLAVRVLDDDDAPLSGVYCGLGGPEEIEMRPGLGPFLTTRRAWTDARGVVAFPDLAPGRYSLRMAQEGRPVQARTVDLVPGPPRLETVRLGGDRALDVRVLGPDTHPVAGATVRIFRANEGYVARQRTDAEGIARIEALPAGPLTVIASAQPAEADAPRWAEARRSGVEDSESEVQLQLLARDSSIRGRVVDGRGGAVGQAWVETDAAEVVLTADDGTFEVAVPSGVTRQLEARTTTPLLPTDRSRTTTELRLGRRARNGTRAAAADVPAGTIDLVLRLN